MADRMLPVAAALAGAVVAVVLGFLTFGAQATVAPDRLPVAVAAPDGPPRAVAERIAAQGGDQLAWRIATPEQARQLLEDKAVYGVLELGQPPVVVVSGAVNPAGTQVAQQALTGVAQALGGGAQVQTVHPASVAGRTAPLAFSTLAWVGCLAGGAVLVLVSTRRAHRPGTGTRLTQVAATSVLVTGVVAGFAKLWDSSLPMGWDVLGFLLLTTAAFAALQTGLLRLLGVRAMAVLGPLYLLAPAVAGQAPELLHEGYRWLLWSWTPFRFSTEGLRSLLQSTPGAPDVATGIWVLGGLLTAGLVVLLWPARPARSAGEEAEADAPDGVVHVGVH
ncbi:ABC transporter permease [Amycolatopsis magusensis]|uniref:ABC transporter permease n=1 Tax=Amycolatopsis magusensis TaxID=882444 RepID=UPI0037B62A34